MKIGFDAKRAFYNLTGLGNYSRSLIKSLSTCFPEYEYYLYSPSVTQHDRLKFINSSKNIEVRTPDSIFYQTFNRYWRSFGLTRQLKKEGIQLYHGLSHELPYNIDKTGIRTVVTIHDLIFLRNPEMYSAIDRNIYLKKVKYSCRIADHIIAISEQTKRDIIEHLNIQDDRITVVYQHCDEQFIKVASNEEKIRVKQKYQLPDDYILNVGTVEARKNLLSLVQAFAQIKKKDVHLVAVGRHTGYARNIIDYIKKEGIGEKVHFIENVEFSDLPAIYQQAQIFVYPSTFEGFGIPIIEALYSKVPVITSRGSCFSEAGGPNGIYINPNEPNEIMEAIDQLLKDGNHCREMIQKGSEFVNKFNELAFAEDTMSVYQQLIC